MPAQARGAGRSPSTANENSAAAEDSDPHAVPGAAPLAGLHVVVVDDNRDAAESLALVLRFHGAEVATAYDGASALSRARQQRPHVMLLDLGMPGMDGFKVAAELQRAFTDQPPLLVALTGWGQQEDVQRTRLAGFAAHLVKPVEPRRVVELLGSARLPLAPA